MLRRLVLGAIAAAVATPAVAHVSLEKGEARIGTSYKAVFKVPHGCDGATTVKVSVEIPEGVIAVKPMVKPGWTIATEKGDYAREYAFYHGMKLKRGVKRVTWSGGSIPNDFYDEFVLATFVAKEIDANQTLAFPFVQTCEKGEIAWKDVAEPGQDPHALEAPAPLLKLVAADAGDDHAHGTSPAVQAGNVRIEGAWSRATPGGARVAAGYLKLTNTGSEAEVLTGGKTDAAVAVEVHEMSEENGVMRMRALADGLELKPGATVELKPGGYHLMLTGLINPLKEGERYKATLEFQRAGPVEVEFTVAPLGAAGPGGGHDHAH